MNGLSELCEKYIRATKSCCKQKVEKNRTIITYDQTECFEILDEIYKTHGPGWMIISDNGEYYIGKTLKNIVKKPLKNAEIVQIMDYEKPRL